MSKHFYTDIDLRFNQLLKHILEHIDSSTITTGTKGRIFWCTVMDEPAYWTGTEVRYFAYKGETILPADIATDENNRFVTDVDIANWDNIVAQVGDFELVIHKNAADGYAGLDAAGKLDFSVLWDGMVVEHPTGSGTYKTLAQLFDIAGGLPVLDDDAELSPLYIKQTGFAPDDPVLFVSQNDIDSWNAMSGTIASGVELIANKGIANGYAPLDSNVQVERQYMPEGVVLRRIKKIEYLFTGNVVEGEELSYTFNDQPTQYFTVGAGEDLEDMINRIAVSLNSRPEVTAISTTDTITVTALSTGFDFDIIFQLSTVISGVLNAAETTITEAYYDIGNLAGVKNIGFAPLNAFGVIDNQYLPDYRDIRVVDTYSDMIAIVDQYNGLRVHVIDASDDPTVDEGWAEYRWLDDLSQWVKTTERETSIDISHDSMQNVRGDGAQLVPPQTNHLTDAQYDQLKNSEYKIIVTHLDARPTVMLKSFDKATFRGASITLTIEDHIGNGTLLEDISLLWDGNYPTMVEFALLSSAMNNPFIFFVDHDINNIYLYAQSNSSDFSSILRIREFEKLDVINAPLVPQDDLLPSNGLFPDLV